MKLEYMFLLGRRRVPGNCTTDMMRDIGYFVALQPPMAIMEFWLVSSVYCLYWAG